jgi:hypothetical protein
LHFKLDQENAPYVPQPRVGTRKDLYNQFEAQSIDILLFSIVAEPKQEHHFGGAGAGSDDFGTAYRK